MATVNIYLDCRAVPSGKEAPLKASINHNSQTAMLPLDIRLLPSQWDKEKKAVINHPNKKYLNSVITGMRFSIEAEILKLAELGRIKDMTARQIKDAVFDVLNPARKADKEREKTFLFRYERIISMKRKENTVAGYKWTLNKLKEYDPHLSEKTFEDITVDYIRGFLNWRQDSINKNSRNVHLRYIRAVFNDAIDAGITTSYPFRHISLRPLPVKKKALTIEQLRMLLSYPCGPQKEEYRDMFLLMLLLRGINIGDLLQATPDQIVGGRLEYRRNKVGSLFSVKIEPEAWTIINKYRGKKHLLSPLDRYKRHNDYLHHLNHALQTLGMERGKYGRLEGSPLFPGLSSNWARHTWATIGAKLDIPKETISKGLGHSFGVAVTDVYIDFDMKKVDEANRKIINYVWHPILHTTSASLSTVSPAI